MKTNLAAIYHHPGMQSLHELLGQQNHRTLVLWALETGEEILKIFESVFPEDPRPARALAAADAWSRGEIKMPLAKIAARETHEAARDAKMAKGKLGVDIEGSRIDAAVAAAHAMGQIIGVVHVGTHATAYAAYAVQAMVLINSRKAPADSIDPEVSLGPEESLAEVVKHLSERLTHWASADKCDRPWAAFL